MTKVEIDLKFNPDHFKEIYFKTGSYSLLFSPGFKSRTYISIVFAILFLGALTYNLYTWDNWGLSFVVFVFFAISSIDVLPWIIKTARWKKHANEYIKSIAKYEEHRIILSSQSISIVQDTSETIEKWATIKDVQILDTHVFMRGVHNYLIPKKSMTDAEFEILKTIVKDRMANIEGVGKDDDNKLVS